MKQKLIKMNTLVIFAVAITIIMIIAMLYCGAMVEKCYNELIEYDQSANRCLELSMVLRQNADDFAALASGFMAGYDRETMRRYWKEIDDSVDFNEVIAELDGLKLNDTQEQSIRIFTDIMQSLRQMELRAMKLVATAMQFEKKNYKMHKTLQDYKLSASDEKLSTEGKVALAREIIYGKTYIYAKESLNKEITYFSKLYYDDSVNAKATVSMTLRVYITIQHLVNFGVATMMAILIWMFVVSLINPIGEYNENLKRGEMLRPYGCVETAAFAEIFNHQHEELTTQNEMLNQANNNYSVLLSNIQGGVIVEEYDCASKSPSVLYISEGFTKLTGYSISDLIDKFNSSHFGIIVQADRQAVMDEYESATHTLGNFTCEYRVQKKDGEIIWIVENGTLQRSSPQSINYQSILTDICEIKMQEQAVMENEQRFRIATAHAECSVFEYDIKTDKYSIFFNTQKIFGNSDEEMMDTLEGMSSKEAIRYFYHKDDVDQVLNARDALKYNEKVQCEGRIRRADGSYLWCMSYYTLVRDKMGEPTKFVGFIKDIKDVKALEQEVMLDPLTGLLNKGATNSKIGKILIEHPEQNHAILILDVDNFKGVNDTLGHLFGDAVLVDVAAKLTRLFSKDDIVGRIGGDEFCVMIKNVQDEEYVHKKAKEVCFQLRESYGNDYKDYCISCSIGIVNSNGCTSFKQLIDNADKALYQTKENGKDGYWVYTGKETMATNRMHRVAEKDSGYLNLSARVFSLMYDSVNFNTSLNMAIRIIGEMLKLDRAYVFENEMDGLNANKLLQWCNNNVPAHDFEGTALPVYDLKYYELFTNNKDLVEIDIEKSCQGQLAKYGFLKPEQMLHFPIYDKNTRLGFIGFDGANISGNEYTELTLTAKTLSVFIAKQWLTSKL